MRQLSTLGLSLAFWACLSAGAMAKAATLTLTSDESISGEGALEATANLASAMYSASIPIMSANGKVFKLQAPNVRCDLRNNHAESDKPFYGLTTIVCRTYAKPTMNNTQGRRALESIALSHAIERVIELASKGERSFMDCAMGRCSGFASDVTCEMDHNVEGFAQGFFKCSITLEDPVSEPEPPQLPTPPVIPQPPLPQPPLPQPPVPQPPATTPEPPAMDPPTLTQSHSPMPARIAPQ